MVGMIVHLVTSIHVFAPGSRDTQRRAGPETRARAGWRSRTASQPLSRPFVWVAALTALAALGLAVTPASARLPSGGQVPATNAAPVQPGMGGMEGINTLTPCLPWEVVSSPNVGTLDNHLRGVAVVSANDVWAVGDYTNGAGHQ